MEENSFMLFAECWTEVSVKRKQIITRQGDTEKYLYLVGDGVQRAFCDHNGREATLVFSYPYSFSGIIDSFFLQQPSRFSLETVTHSRLLKIHFEEVRLLMEQHRSIDTWMRIALTSVLSDTLSRHIELLTYTAEEKFSALLQRSPHLLNLIPHKYLASYIGMDATNFSKILGKVRLQ